MTGFKPFFLNRAASAGQGVGEGTNSDLDEVGRRGEFLVGLVFKKVGHDFIPDRGSAGDTGGDLTHGRVVIVAYPDGGEQVGGVADGPVVAQVLGGAGLDGNVRVPVDI